MSPKQKTSYSGAILRMQRDERLATQADPKVEAERHEQFFLGSMRAAKEHFDWIVEHAAWTLLGFDTFASWWETRVVPIADVLGMRPTREIAKVVIEKVVEEQKDLPKAQQRTQRQIAAMVGVDKSTVARSTPGANAPGSDLDSDPLESFPDVEKALEDFHNNQTSGLAGDDSADDSGEDHPAPAEPGEADGAGTPAAADVNAPSAPQAAEDSPPVESSAADGPERAVDAGVSLPSAPVPAKDEDDPERVEHEMRTRMSERFCEAIVTLSQGFASGDPIWWLEEMYLPGAYKMRGLPGVNECFDPESLRLLAARIHMIADHRDETGMKLP